jgi:hypothetical protein
VYQRRLQQGTNGVFFFFFFFFCSIVFELVYLYEEPIRDSLCMS